MSAPPDLASVRPVAHIMDVEESALLNSARGFLAGFNWAGEIEEEHIGAVFPGIVAILLFRIKPTRPDVDDWLWVVIGDVPPAYLVCDECKNPWEALDGYIGEMEAWVEAASAGRSVEKLIPVNVLPTPASADALRTRLKFLDERIMPLLPGAPQ